MCPAACLDCDNSKSDFVSACTHRTFWLFQKKILVRIMELGQDALCD